MVAEAPLSVIKELIIETYLAGSRKSWLIFGMPGIGKSETIKQVAEELAKQTNRTLEVFEFQFTPEGGVINYTNLFKKAIEILKNPEEYFVLIEMRAYEYEPTDLSGIPKDINFENMRVFDYNPFLWHLVASACPGILYIDEITNVHRPDQKSQLQKVLLDRKTGWVKFHPDLIVIGTGNRPEDSPIADMPINTWINRCWSFIAQPYDIDEWAEYMNKKYGDKWDKRVYAFLKRFSQFYITQPEELETYEAFATPRSWTTLAEVSWRYKIGDKADEYKLELLARASVGREAAAHFMVFIKTDIPDVKELVKDPSILEELDVDGRYLAMAQLAPAISKVVNANKPIDVFTKVLTWLYENDREMLQILWSMMNSNSTRKFWMLCFKNKNLRPIAEFFKQTYKITVDALG